MTNTQYTYPKALIPSQSTVGIMSISAPEGAKNPENLDRGLDWLRQQGFRVIEAPSLRKNAGYLSAAPDIVANELSMLIQNTKVDAVFCAGGGMNANALLDAIDYKAISINPKPILGMSNPSVLLNAITARSHVVTFHGPAVIWNMGAEGGLNDFSKAHLWRALVDLTPDFVLNVEPSWNWLRPGKAHGPVFGGNLWSLQQLIGTPYFPDMRGAILFVEDCFCQTHQVAAILAHFKTSKVLADLKAVIVGIFEGVEEKEYSPASSIEELVLQNVPPGIPVIAGVSLGHTEQKVTIPIGATCEMDSDKGALRFFK
jgi:muramoyltetrapeptide carboxypeptidase